MKITHICLITLFGEDQTYQENLLAKYHVRLGHEVSAIISQWQWDKDRQLKRLFVEPYINKDGVHVFPVPTLYGTLDTKIKWYRSISKTLETLSPDILFIHGCQFLNMFTLARYLRRHPNVKVYVDNHADFSNSARNWLSKNILHKIIWRICAWVIEPYVTKFYGVLPARVDFLKDVYGLPADKCELLVMGADDEMVEQANKPEVRTGIRQKYNIAESDFLIVTGGKIDAFKSQTLLLMQAVHNINSQKLKLLIFGSVAPELQQKVKQLADGKKVQYIGWINGQDSYSYFSAADLVCFPGRHSVFWEQVTGQGVPLIVKDWPGTHHVDVGGNVRFLTRDSVQEIQQIIEEIVNDQAKYQKMKYAAQQNGMKKFSYKEIAKRSIETGV